MPQILRSTPRPGLGDAPAGRPAPAQPVSPPGGVRPKRPWGWIAGGVVVLLAVPITLIGVYRTGDRLPAAAAAAAPPVESAPRPAAPVVSPSVASPSVAGAPTGTAPSVPVSASAPVGPSAGPSLSWTPAPKPSVTGWPNPSGANLALQGTATASASEGYVWRPANAIDGDLFSRWSSALSDDQWIRVDLGRDWQISEIVLVWWKYAYGAAYRVETSLDGETWTPVYATKGEADGVVRISESAVARYVQVRGTKRIGIYRYSLLELKIR